MKEVRLMDRMPKNEEVVEKGNPNHEHVLTRTDWNRERLGGDVELLDNYYARYKDLYVCVCGRQVVRSVVAYI